MNNQFINENMMGPNAWLIAEELLKNIPLKKGMRVLDLGCGRGLTSIFLASHFDVEVYAVDLWISPSENYERFKTLGFNSIIPLQLDANHLPFPKHFFDAIISIDAYHYFGNTDDYFPNNIKPLLKENAYVAIAIPGLNHEVMHSIPQIMKPEEEALTMWHSIEWWKPKFNAYLHDFHISTMSCFNQAWQDWLACDNPYAIEDRPMMEADQGHYMNLIKITGHI